MELHICLLSLCLSIANNSIFVFCLQSAASFLHTDLTVERVVVTVTVKTSRRVMGSAEHVSGIVTQDGEAQTVQNVNQV